MPVMLEEGDERLLEVPITAGRDELCRHSPVALLPVGQHGTATCVPPRLRARAGPQDRQAPESPGWIAARIVSSVVLPAPFGPMHATSSPRRASNETPLSASRPP